MALSFVDLYAGCGGLSLGLTQAGGTGVLAIEKSSDAFKTIEHNLLNPASGGVGFRWPNGIPCEPFEIRTLLAKHAAQIASLHGSVDLVAGGPPCQGFSAYGKRNPNDPRNHLWTAYLQFVELIAPRMVLLENVAGIDMPFIRGRKGTGKACRETTAHRIRRKLEAMGFASYVLTLCASDYGVPQFRPRLFLIGFRDKPQSMVDSLLTQEFCDEMRLSFLSQLGLNTSEKLSVVEAISDLETLAVGKSPCTDTKGFLQAGYKGPQTAFQISMRAGMAPDQAPNSMRLARHKPSTVEKFLTIQQLGVRGYKAAAKFNAVMGTSKHRIHWLDPAKPAPTITTIPDDFVHYSEPRALTVRECARIQSFPDWFDFLGRYTTGGDRRKTQVPRFTQVGNAVPPRLGQFLGCYIQEAARRLEALERAAIAA